MFQFPLTLFLVILNVCGFITVAATAIGWNMPDPVVLVALVCFLLAIPISRAVEQILLEPTTESLQLQAEDLKLDEAEDHPMPLPKGYSFSQITLHWVAAGVIALQFMLEDSIGEAWQLAEHGGAEPVPPLVTAHVLGGSVVFALVLLRLVLRFARGVPALPAGGALSRMVSHLGNGFLYVLMVALPLTGAVAWFASVGDAGNLHETLTTLLLAAVGMHVAHVFWHHFWRRDNLLLRMRRPLD
jgi:cytochrome b561